MLVQTINLLYSVAYATLGYLIPLYSTAKALNSDQTESLRYWSAYWVVFGLFFCCQWLIDFLVCWLPFYYIGKLGFICALWHPATQWCLPLYRMTSQLLATYEADIDRAVHEAQVHCLDLVGHQAQQLTSQARVLAGNATVMLKNAQQKAVQKSHTVAAKMQSSHGAVAGEGHGLHRD